MKVPIRWLKDYVDFDLSLGALVNRLALAGLEVSGINHWGLPAPEGLRLGAEDPYPVWDKDKIIIGLVTKVDKHPDADRLKLPTVEYGSGRSITMVTGAPNLSVGDTGQKVILALSGSVLFDGHATPKVLKELKPGKIRALPAMAWFAQASNLVSLKIMMASSFLKMMPHRHASCGLLWRFHYRNRHSA